MDIIERNIYRYRGQIRVSVTRRPNILVRRCKSIEEARSLRDEFEKQFPALKPWGVAIRKVAKRRTQQQLRMERRAKGVCQVCGDKPPKQDRVTCQECLTWQNDKRKLARQEAKTAA